MALDSFFHVVYAMYSADEQIVSRTLAGDRDAFGILVHKYQEMVFAYAFQKVRNEADAQDVMQEVFLRAYRSLYALRQPHRFRSWLYTIMSNECNRWLARAAKTRQREVLLADAGGDELRVEPGHTISTEGWRADLEQAMAALPDENRVAVSMFYMGDCSLKEISEFLGVSVNTVRGKLHRARQQLGNALAEQYGRLLKSHKLGGGFLMQMMEQLRHTSAPTMGFAWSSATVGKTVFSLIMALCILIGLIGARDDLPTELSSNQIGVSSSGTNRLPMEVALLESAPYLARSPITGVPEPTGKRPPGASSGRASMEQSSRSVNRGVTSAANGAKTPSSQFSAVTAENAPEKLTYSGRVVNDDGEPVEGAEILYAVNWGGTTLGTRTTEDGRFRFELVRPELGKWAEKRLDIVVAHPDYAHLWRKLSLKNTENVEIQLDASGTIAGRVMNEAGAPIANAEATIQFTDGNASSPRTGDYKDYSMLDIFHHTPPAKTEENGEFVFRNLPPRATTVLSVQGPGYAKTKRIFVPVGRQDLEFRLKREARIEGRLSYAESGEPVANAKVEVLSADPLDGAWSASVDENGDFVVKNLGPGTYNLFLDYIDKGPEGWTAAARLGIKVSEGQTVSDMYLTLIRCGLITGRTSDKDTDEPLGNVIIDFHDAARPESQSSQHNTDPDDAGVYRFHAAPGRVLVAASAPPGYLDIGEVRRYVDVVEGESVTVDFQFSKGLELVVRTLTKADEPVPDAWVADELTMDRLPNGGRSNEKGEFTFGGLRSGQLLLLKAEHGELQLRGTAMVETQPGKSIEIRMEQFSQVKVSGRVVDEKGEPMPSVPIIMSPWDRQRKSLVATNAGVTDSDGRFQAVGLVDGEEYIIHANVDPDVYYGATTGPFTATAEMDDLADLVVDKLPPDLAAKQRAQNAYMNDVIKRSEILMGQPAPELEVEEWLTGAPVSIRDWKGKPIALYFWEPAHLNYRQWVDLLNSLHQTYHEKGLVCTAVCAAPAKVEKVKQHIAEQPLDYSVGLDRATDVVGARGKTFDRYAVWSSNSVVLINPEGEIAGIVAAHAINEDVFPVNLENRIKALLGN